MECRFTVLFFQAALRNIVFTPSPGYFTNIFLGYHSILTKYVTFNIKINCFICLLINMLSFRGKYNCFDIIRICLPLVTIKPHIRIS